MRDFDLILRKTQEKLQTGTFVLPLWVVIPDYLEKAFFSVELSVSGRFLNTTCR